jgi:hypothetical protein
MGYDGVGQLFSLNTLIFDEKKPDCDESGEIKWTNMQ